MPEPEPNQDVNKNWLFHPGKPVANAGKALQKQGAATQKLPHCWNTEDTFKTGVSYRRGWGSYYKTIPGSDLEKEVGFPRILKSGGFFGFGFLRINGKKVLEFDAQYLGFEFDLTPFIAEGQDLELCIAVCNLHRSTVLPGIKDPDFILYGGLAANLQIEKRPLVSLPENTIHAFCERIEGSPFLKVEFEMENTSGEEWVGQVQWSLLDSVGAVEIRIGAGKNEPSSCKLNSFTDIEKWSPDNPVLYTLKGEVMEGDNILQTVEIPFGFRELDFDEDGQFLLNGVETKIRGCNRHESMPGVGNALSDEQHTEDARLIKSLGFNAVRLSHYPQNPAFLDACDREGLLVYAEIASWKTVKTGAWLKAACRQLEGMIRRDRNHPSIFLWGLGNESRSAKAFAAMTKIIRALDPHRFTIYAENHLYRAKRKDTLNSVDVWGCNYELDLLEELKQCSRTGAVIVSECSNQPHAVRGNLEEELKQIEQFDRDLDIIDQSGVAGFFIWSFQDYATLRKKRYARYCGVVDAWRNPKLSAAYLKVRFSETLELKGCILEGQVIVFTNADEIEIQEGAQVTTHQCKGLMTLQDLKTEESQVKISARRGEEKLEKVLSVYK